VGQYRCAPSASQLVEPSGFRTDWAGRSANERSAEIADCAETAGAARREMRELGGKQPGDPVRACERDHPGAEAAGAQGQFWAMHDVLFENPQALGDEDLVGYAGALGLDEARFVREPTGHVHAARVREDFMGGVRSGVNG